MFAWARELVLLGVLWVIYSIYHREDTSSKGGNQPNGKTKTSKVPPVTVPPVEFEKMNHYEVLGVSDDATAEDLKVGLLISRSVCHSEPYTLESLSEEDPRTPSRQKP